MPRLWVRTSGHIQEASNKCEWNNKLILFFPLSKKKSIKLKMGGGSPSRTHGFPLLTPQVIIICLVVLDALLVLAELILDLKIIQPDKNNYAARVGCHRPFHTIHSCDPYPAGTERGSQHLPQGLGREEFGRFLSKGRGNVFLSKL